MTLTEVQKKAVQTVGKNVLVSAGAGTGKTRVLVERVLHLLRSQKAGLTELLVLTFTEKAANEIKTRLSRSFREWGLERPRRDLDKAAISTFHGFASRLLKEHPVEAGVDPDFRVIETEQSELLKEESMREMIVKFYEDRDDAFELLSAFGDETVREGVLKVFTAARHEGKDLREFFLESEKKERDLSAQKKKTLPAEARKLIHGIEGIDVKSWERFLKNTQWDWGMFRDFKTWSELYKGKKKGGWKEWRALLEDLGALRLGPLALSWKEKFERMALAFEAVYDARKKEKGFLDFDDLQGKAVGLFRGEKLALRRLREQYQRKFKFILVDEFQDTNFLQMEFVELLASGQNLFMVGDYKQSIYGFRGAEPGIFLQKEKLYEDGAAGEKLVLAESFRSDPPVLDFVNRFFKRLWEEDSFPFEALRARQDSGNGTGARDPAVELMITNLREDEDMRCARLREARVIAARIRKLHEKEKIPYGHIAVLFQAMTLSGIYEDAFKSAGVPYFIVAGRGFYEQPEIQDMMSFLSHLERPFADIPLAAALRSPLFHITDDTLFWMSRYAKAEDENAPLCHAFKVLDRISEIAPEQKARLKTFLELTGDLGALKDRIPLSDLIDRTLEKTGYELSVLIDPKGVRRYANLKKLMVLVREYETYERISLASFLNVLKRLRAQEVRESEAQITPESSTEAVRMMSVHAAKGLEFPVVFVADMGRQGFRPDSKTVIAHAANGYAIQVPDGIDHEMQKPFFFRWVDQEIVKREDEEWKRLFYVAVTRAKSRLFLSGVYKKKAAEKATFREMASWMDWAMAICEDESMNVKRSVDTVIFREPQAETTEDFSEKIKKIVRSAKPKEKAAKRPGNGAFGLPLPRSIDLPVSAYTLFQKTPGEFWRTYQIGWTLGGSEWAGEEAMFHDEDFSAADFGTAMHAFFEHLDLANPDHFMETETLDRIFGRFGEKAVDDARRIIEEFIKQPLFKTLAQARQVKREIDFVLNERRGLIHGKIDMLFEDVKGDWHILDYKTASGDEEAARQSAYDLQMEIYALAARSILKLPVRSAMIYYLKNQKTVTLAFPPEKDKEIFGDLEKKVRDLQQRILDYSNQRMEKECGAST